jgi:hypothetical protein
LVFVELRLAVLPLCQQLPSRYGRACSAVPQPSRVQQQLPGHLLGCMVRHAPLPQQQECLEQLPHPWQHHSM